MINPATNKVEAGWPTAPMTSPHGMAIDFQTHHIFSAGQGKVVMLDENTGKVLSSVDIAPGYVDQIAFDQSNGRLYCACGDAGVISVVQENGRGCHAAGQRADASESRIRWKWTRTRMRSGFLTRDPTGAYLQEFTAGNRALEPAFKCRSFAATATVSQLFCGFAPLVTLKETRKTMSTFTARVSALRRRRHILALVPIGRGLFAAPGTALPHFTALPYVQPGSASRLVDGQETMVIAWQTEHFPADFTLDYGPSKAYGKSAVISRAERWQGDSRDKRYNYAADLSRPESEQDLLLSPARGRDKQLLKATLRPAKSAANLPALSRSATTPTAIRASGQSRTMPTRLTRILLSTPATMSMKAAWTASMPSISFPIYNADTPDPKVGAPLLRSVPFYTVMANHDVHHKDAQKHPAADFDKDRGRTGLLHGHAPAAERSRPRPVRPRLLAIPSLIADFQAVRRQRASRRWRITRSTTATFIFCASTSNDYIDPTSPALQAWIASDLQGNRCPLEVCRLPSSGVQCRRGALQRAADAGLSPLFEAHGVDFCLHGHEHVYQRTMPLRFAPSDLTKAPPSHVSDRRIPGTFTLDTKFDGKT